jgi:hypothetical protein
MTETTEDRNGYHYVIKTYHNILRSRHGWRNYRLVVNADCVCDPVRMPLVRVVDSASVSVKVKRIGCERILEVKKLEAFGGFAGCPECHALFDVTRNGISAFLRHSNTAFRATPYLAEAIFKCKRDGCWHCILLRRIVLGGEVYSRPIRSQMQHRKS